VRWQVEIIALIGLIAMGSLGMWYTGSQYLRTDFTLENEGENFVTGWVTGASGGGSGGGTAEGTGSLTFSPPVDISESAKVLLVFVGLGIMVGAGIGVLIARVRVLLEPSETKIEKPQKIRLKREVLEFVKQRGAFTISELIEHTGASKRKIERYVQKLAKRGIIKPSGEGDERTGIYVYVGE
jgi:uncharacterized membrane protein